MPRKNTISIAILAHSKAHKAAVLGMKDILETASQHAEAQKSGYKVEVFVASLKGLAPIKHRMDVLIIPPILVGNLKSSEEIEIIDFLMKINRKRVLLCSVCAGAFLLAKAGLLENGRATTHWVLESDFRKQFPDVNLAIDELLIDNGDSLLAGGLMAWVDLCLALVERYLGRETMLAMAKYFLVDPTRRRQSYFRTFNPPREHGDEAIRNLQNWLETNFSDPVSLDLLAKRAKLGERTLIRRFRGATGYKPTEYLQNLRVEKARSLLEKPASKLAVDEISWQVGYQDGSAFRKVFRRLVGLSPNEYRGRFAQTNL